LLVKAEKLVCCAMKSLSLGVGSCLHVNNHRKAHVLFCSFGRGTTSLLAHWCCSKGVVKFLMFHCQGSNILELAKPNLLHFSEPANNAICIFELAVGKSGVPKTQPTKNLHPARAAKAHSSGWHFPMPATSQCM
jgi:hypothetical protein